MDIYVRMINDPGNRTSRSFTPLTMISLGFMISLILPKLFRRSIIICQRYNGDVNYTLSIAIQRQENIAFIMEISQNSLTSFRDLLLSDYF